MRSRGVLRARLSTLGAVLALSFGAAVLAGACAPGPTGSPGLEPTVAPGLPSRGPSRTPGVVVERTRSELVRVLGERGLVLQDAAVPFRPPEDETFTVAPRGLFQAILPDAPGEGYIVVYEFASPTEAASAATAQADYLASGPARVQVPFGTRHIMRLVGSTVVVHSWVPEGAEDPRQPEIQAALETLGTAVPIPR